MPLHAQAEPVLFNRLVGFNHAVRAGGADAEAVGQIVHGHVVRTVDSHFTRPVDGVQARARDDFQHVPQILLDRITMMQGARHVFGNVLVQSSAAQDVDQLHAAADGQDRHLALNGQLGHATVKVFTTSRHDTHRRMLMLFLASRVEVQCAAGKHHATNCVHHAKNVIILLHRGHQEGQTAGS